MSRKNDRLDQPDRLSVTTVPESGRLLIDSFEREFARLHSRSCGVVRAVTAEQFYSSPPGAASGQNSIGENILRCAAAVEQTFGGITSNLWDDPFEWTLPENLSTARLLLDYLEEVEETRKRGFASFSSDEALSKTVAVPSGKLQPLIELLLETLVRAAQYQARAFELFNLSKTRSVWSNTANVVNNE